MSAFAGFQPGRLWSLWDIMRQFDGGKLFIGITGLSNLAHVRKGGSNNTSFFAIPRSNHENTKATISFVCNELKLMGLDATLISAETLKDILNNEVEHKTGTGSPGDLPVGEWAFFNNLTMGRYQNYAKDLVTRFKDELSARVVFTVPSEKAQYFHTDADSFCCGVFGAFPSANDDVVEAGICLSLGRATACVMHLMRVCESGLAALAGTVGVTKQNDWGSYIRKIEEELSKRIKASGARTPDEQFYAEASASFDHVRRAWRNPTLHIERSYSPDRAEEIFLAVRSFMRHLATKVHE